MVAPYRPMHAAVSIQPMPKALLVGLLCTLLLLIGLKQSATATASGGKAPLQEGQGLAHTGSELGELLLDQETTDIVIDRDVTLEDYMDVVHMLTTRYPFTLKRDITLHGRPVQQLPDSSGFSGLRRPILDLAYLSCNFNLSAGTSITFKGLHIRRGSCGIPCGMFSASPGAHVAFEDTVQEMEVCPPASVLQHLLAAPGTSAGCSASGEAVPDDACLARFEEEPLSVSMSGLQLLVPLTPADIGGYSSHFLAGTRLTCGSEVPFPAACEGLLAQGGSAAVAPECMAAVRAAMKHSLCGREDCINACALSCEAQNQRSAKKHRYRTTFQRWH